jgi:hypothetical protein
LINTEDGPSPPRNENDIMNKLISNESIAIVADDDRRRAEEKMVDTNRTIRREDHIDASKEVRSLLEFLFLDVKVRSPVDI